MIDRNASNRMDRGAEGTQAEWLSAMQSLAEQIQKQQQNSQQMIQELMNTYMQLLNTPGSYLSGQAEQQQQTLGPLSHEDLREVRDYEERTKNRETILEQLDRRIRSGS